MTDQSRPAPAWVVRIRRTRRHIADTFRILFKLPNFYGGMQRDHQALVVALQASLRERDVLRERLAWYENNVPVIKKEKARYEAMLKKRAKAKRQALQ